MKSVLEVCLIGIVFTCAAAAQDPSKPQLRPGIHVQLPTVSSAVAMPDADQENATIVAITANGKLFLGTRPVEISGLASTTASTIYIKADAHASYQTVLDVLDALKSHELVLLAVPKSHAKNSAITPPYGVRVTLGAR